jgi:hypothetical protein
MAALDFSDELLQLNRDYFSEQSRVIVTSTADKDQEKEFQDIKEAYFSKQKPLIVQLDKEQTKGTQSAFEKTEHFYALCQGNLDKFIILFTMVKLAIAEGKTLVFCRSVMQAYRIKLFFNRFHLKSFVLAPDMPKNQIKSIVHYFHIGQFDILIMVHSGYATRPPPIKEIQTVINFDIPASFNQYKESGSMVEQENGCVLTLVEPDLNITASQIQNATQDVETLHKIMRKLEKNFGRNDVLKCIPVLWGHIVKFKSRVESVLGSLSNKAVAREKMIEFKK